MIYLLDEVWGHIILYTGLYALFMLWADQRLSPECVRQKESSPSTILFVGVVHGASLGVSFIESTQWILGLILCASLSSRAWRRLRQSQSCSEFCNPTKKNRRFVAHTDWIVGSDGECMTSVLHYRSAPFATFALASGLATAMTMLLYLLVFGSFIEPSKSGYY